jgi:hypothetical protein
MRIIPGLGGMQFRRAIYHTRRMICRRIKMNAVTRPCKQGFTPFLPTERELICRECLQHVSELAGRRLVDRRWAKSSPKSGNTARSALNAARNSGR